MLKHGILKLLLVSAVVFSCGCASVFYPDFDDDIVVDDGGKVEVRKVENRGVLISDKSNALYENEEGKTTDDKSTDDKSTDDKLSSQDEDKEIAVVSESIEPNQEMADKPQDEQLQKPAMRYLAGVVYFADGGSEVNAEGYAVLRKIAQTAKKNNAQVEVYGFASSRTRNTDPVSHKLANFKVSSQRADKVASVLRNLGVKSGNIAVQALSDSMPLYKEVMPEGERLNRRAEVYLTY